MLTSPGCDAVTDGDGRFRVACEPGTRSFVVAHPDHLDRTWPVTADGAGEHDVGVVSLASIPLGEGLWLAGDGRLDPLPPAPIVRTATADEQRWCLDATRGEPVPVPVGHVRLLDNHTVDWRIYALDADRCAYRMTPAAGGNWTFAAERVPVPPGVPRGPGREWVELDLPLGDYAIVEWYEGFLVRGPDDTWRGHWLRVGAPAPTDSGTAAKDALTPRPAEATPAP
ncbi:MAG: hypothetical protein Q8P41_24235 [Pseudomonadota bacterium]|nr:hypothetical protein [Pseudomonadota bacterium]